MDSIPIAEYFEQYEWTAEEIEADVWRTTFTTESEEDFDLYVMVAEEWVHFAVSPLVRIGEAEQQPRLIGSLLRLNQRMRLVRLGLEVTVRMLACFRIPPRRPSVRGTRRNSGPFTPSMP